jgi:hypothetical protein
VQQVAEKPAAERVIAEIMNDAAAIREGPRFHQGGFGRLRKSRQQQRLDRRIPRRIDHRFVRQH